MAALPPQPPGGMPPEPPGVAPPGGPPAGPPQGPYSPGGAYAGQMPAQPYVSQPMPQPVVVKVHKRTFWLTIAQIIIIVFAIARILLGILAAGIGVLFLTAGRARIESLPGYDQAAGQLGNGVINVLAAFLFAVAAYLAHLRNHRPDPRNRCWATVQRRALVHHRAGRDQPALRHRSSDTWYRRRLHTRTAGVPGWQGDRALRAPDRPCDTTELRRHRSVGSQASAPALTGALAV